MGSTKAAEIIEAAEHLLYPLARTDVEKHPPRGTDLLYRLIELEGRAADLNISDLYCQVLLRCW